MLEGEEETMTEQEIANIIAPCEKWEHQVDMPDFEDFACSVQWWNKQCPFKSLVLHEDGCVLDVDFEHPPSLKVAMDMGNVCTFYDYDESMTSFTLGWR
jgi:hypothetical protein